MTTTLNSKHFLTKKCIIILNKIFSDFSNLFKNNKCIIAGGFMVDLFLHYYDFEKKKFTENNNEFIYNDIDIYININNSKNFYDILYNKYNKNNSKNSNSNTKISNTKISNTSAYDNSFLIKNNVVGIIKIELNINDIYISKKYLELMLINDNIELKTVVENFDLSFCKIYFDGKNITILNYDDLINKSGFLGSEYVIKMLQGNVFTMKRLKKYTKKGFSIEYENVQDITNYNITANNHSFEEIGYEYWISHKIIQNYLHTIWVYNDKFSYKYDFYNSYTYIIIYIFILSRLNIYQNKFNEKYIYNKNSIVSFFKNELYIDENIYKFLYILFQIRLFKLSNKAITKIEEKYKIYIENYFNINISDFIEAKDINFYDKIYNNFILEQIKKYYNKNYQELTYKEPSDDINKESCFDFIDGDYLNINEYIKENKEDESIIILINLPNGEKKYICYNIDYFYKNLFNIDTILYECKPNQKVYLVRQKDVDYYYKTKYPDAEFRQDTVEVPYSYIENNNIQEDDHIIKGYFLTDQNIINRYYDRYLPEVPIEDREHEVEITFDYIYQYSIPETSYRKEFYKNYIIEYLLINQDDINNYIYNLSQNNQNIDLNNIRVNLDYIEKNNITNYEKKYILVNEYLVNQYYRTERPNALFRANSVDVDINYIEEVNKLSIEKNDRSIYINEYDVPYNKETILNIPYIKIYSDMNIYISEENILKIINLKKDNPDKTVVISLTKEKRIKNTIAKNVYINNGSLVSNYHCQAGSSIDVYTIE